LDRAYHICLGDLCNCNFEERFRVHALWAVEMGLHDNLMMIDNLYSIGSRYNLETRHFDCDLHYNLDYNLHYNYRGRGTQHAEEGLASK
jgi:hypothetical protein